MVLEDSYNRAKGLRAMMGGRVRSDGQPYTQLFTAVFILSTGRQVLNAHRVLCQTTDRQVLNCSLLSVSKPTNVI
jgi:hypothetical protein